MTRVYKTLREDGMSIIRHLTLWVAYRCKGGSEGRRGRKRERERHRDTDRQRNRDIEAGREGGTDLVEERKRGRERQRDRKRT